jgi:hypothetical protein
MPVKDQTVAQTVGSRQRRAGAVALQTRIFRMFRIARRRLAKPDDET